MNFISYVQWPKEAGVIDNISRDEHLNWELAKGVVDVICCHGFGGDGKIFPVKVWIEDENGTVFIKDPKKTELSPSKFVWQKYCGRLGWAISQLMQNPYSSQLGKLKLQVGVMFIGWCDASRIQIRQRPEGFVLMVEIDGEETWFHAMELPTEA